MERKKIIINVIEYILAFCIIINANTVWNYVYLKDFNCISSIITLYLLIILSIKNILINKKNIFIISILIIFISSYNTIFILINGQGKLEFIIDFIFIFIGFIIYNLSLANKNEVYSILFKISNIMVVLSIISLIYYIGGSILKYIHPTQYIHFKWGWSREIPSYNNLYYQTQVQVMSGKIFIRNTGIFTEAPMYGFSLSIALLTELFLRKVKDIKLTIISLIKIIILIITIITTLSTTAISIMSVAIPIRIIIVVLENLKKSKKIIFVNIFLLVIFILVGIKIGGYFLHNKVKNSANNKYASFSVRKDDIKVGYKVWKENKIFGAGFNQYQYVQQQMNFIGRGDDIGGSSGLMKVMPEGGLVLLGMYIIPFILAMLYGIKKRDLRVISVYIFVYILFIVTAIQYRYMMIYFLALGFSYILAINENKTTKENNK